MDQGFIKANSSNLPRIDSFMLGAFFAANPYFCSAEFRNVKTSISSRPSYGDDAVSYVQLRRDGKMCIVKCKICPELKVHAKLYTVTLIVDEEAEAVVSVECHDCIAFQGGCKHSMAFLMWTHRRSEEPSCTFVECYWKKSKLSRVGTRLKFMTAKEMSNDAPSIPDTPAMKRGRLLEEQVRKAVSSARKLRCGLRISKEYPMIAGSPDWICEDSIIEIKCPISTKTYQNYVKNGKPTEKFNIQMQIQMYLTGLKKGYFCVAYSDYSSNKRVDI